MPYVYKYENKKTKDIEYVGISETLDTLSKRLKSHEYDSWYVPGKYDIYYIEVETHNDAEALEGHFINEYQSYRFNNKEKKSWGASSYAPKDIKWVKTNAGNPIKACIEKRLDRLKKQELDLMIDIGKLERRVAGLQREVIDATCEVPRFRRQSVRKWFNQNFCLTYSTSVKKYKATKELLYKLHNEWIQQNVEEWNFDDEDDFWDAMLDVKEFRPFIEGDEMYSFITREEATRFEKEAVTNLEDLFDVV